MSVSDEQLAELRRLTDAATPGPWRDQGRCKDEAEFGHPVLGGGPDGSMSEHQVAWMGEFLNRKAHADAAFVAAARDAVPVLLAEVQRLRDEHAEAVFQYLAAQKRWEADYEQAATMRAERDAARVELAAARAQLDAVGRANTLVMQISMTYWSDYPGDAVEKEAQRRTWLAELRRAVSDALGVAVSEEQPDE